MSGDQESLLECRRARAAMEEDLRVAIRNFENRFGATVGSVQLLRKREIGIDNNTLHHVEIEVVL